MSRHRLRSNSRTTTSTSTSNPRFRCTTTNNKCPNPHCFFCMINDRSPSPPPIRQARISLFLNNLPDLAQTQNQVPILSYIWNFAMTQPDNPLLPSLGIFDSMAKLILKAVTNIDWLITDQNIFIPYYAAHIIGSYTMTKPEFTRLAVRSGAVVPGLMELLRGKISWVEQRVAVRALGHIASYDETFDALAEYEDEVVGLTMGVARNCVELVYRVYVGVEDRGKRMSYHSDLLTRGISGSEMENRKAEEWVNQLQCWCVSLLSCFACRGGGGLGLICENEGFLKECCGIWGGIVRNEVSPGGVGLIRVLCYSEIGRRAVAGVKEVVDGLVRLCRSCDDWQYIGIDCLLLLLRDLNTRWRVMEEGVVCCLVDLIELRRLRERSRIGEMIISSLKLVKSDHRRKDYYKSKLKNKAVQCALEEVTAFVKRRRWEKTMISKEKIEDKRVLAELMEKQGNRSFMAGEVEEAVKMYTEALEVCPVRMKKERMVLYGNRAQCCLVLRDYNGVIRNTTRALCLSNPTNSDGMSLWRRCVAYDMMKGFGRESLMDCVMFVNCYIKKEESVRRKVCNNVKIPKFVASMIRKQMKAVWLFAGAKLKEEEGTTWRSRLIRSHDGDENVSYESDCCGGEDADLITADGIDRSKRLRGLSTILEEPLSRKVSLDKKQMAERQAKK